MGITINDTLSLDIGISLAGTYASFGNQSTRSNPTSGTYNYNLYATADIWADAASRAANSSKLQSMRVILGITKGQLDSNIYCLLYDELKTNFTSTSDVLD